MKRLFPNLSDLFVTWASAGQYGAIAEMDNGDDASESNASKVHALPSAGAAKRHTVKNNGVQRIGGNASSEPKYIDGSMLVKRRLG